MFNISEMATTTEDRGCVMITSSNGETALVESTRSSENRTSQFIVKNEAAERPKNSRHSQSLFDDGDRRKVSLKTTSEFSEVDVDNVY